MWFWEDGRGLLGQESPDATLYGPNLDHTPTAIMFGTSVIMILLGYCGHLFGQYLPGDNLPFFRRMMILMMMTTSMYWITIGICACLAKSKRQHHFNFRIFLALCVPSVAAVLLWGVWGEQDPSHLVPIATLTFLPASVGIYPCVLVFLNRHTWHEFWIFPFVQFMFAVLFCLPALVVAVPIHLCLRAGAYASGLRAH